jgi:DnaK suppressor protein
MTMTAKRQPVVEPTAQRALLTGLYLELSAEIDEALALADAVGVAADRAGEDDADSGTRLSHREQQLSLLSSVQQRRAQVERAIERLDAGTYGRCEQCDGAIPRARLEAFPAVTTCVDCKRRSERQV